MASYESWETLSGAAYGVSPQLDPPSDVKGLVRH
jgi:hypothetical protein